MKLLGRVLRSTSAKVAVGVLVGTLIAVPAAVWAVTSFTDVPKSHPFYKEIIAVAGAGIAQGFGDGTYRPGNNITRQAMAAFMERGVGRAAGGETNGTRNVTPNVETEIAVAALDVGANGAGTTGFVHVSGSVQAGTNQATTYDCPCTIRVDVVDKLAGIVEAYVQVPLLPDGEYALGSTSLNAVVPVVGDSTHRYSLVARGLDDFTGTMSVEGSLAATYFPFSGDGDDTLAYELSCPKDDSSEQNDTQDVASPLYFTGQTTAISCPSDRDWYANNVPGLNPTITVDVTFSNAEGNIDVCLYRFAMAVACSTGVTDSENISYPSAAPGRYSIEVYLEADAGPTPGNTYTLRAGYE